jgi:hypothetical protein
MSFRGDGAMSGLAVAIEELGDGELCYHTIFVIEVPRDFYVTRTRYWEPLVFR